MEQKLVKNLLETISILFLQAINTSQIVYIIFDFYHINNSLSKELYLLCLSQHKL